MSHIKVASLLLTMVEHPPPGHGRDGFYMAENGSMPIYPALQAIATALHAMDLVDTDKPTLYGTEEAGRYKVRPTLDLTSGCRNHD